MPHTRQIGTRDDTQPSLVSAISPPGQGNTRRWSPSVGSPEGATPSLGWRLDTDKPFLTIRRQTFIKTAVARKDLEAAYPLVGPSIKQGMSLAEWKTGNIAVIPFPLDKLDFAPFKVDYAHPDDVLMEVALLAKGGPA